MVKVRQASDEDRLEALLRQACETHKLTLSVEGWSRKTYDVYYREGRLGANEHVARVESLATSNGEVHYFDDRAQAFAEEVAAALEREFAIAEAVLVRDKAPNDY